jgi:uncharacterized protein (TIGR03067 family)
MRRVVLALTVVGLLAGLGAAGTAGEKKKDEDVIQGTWLPVSGEKEGKQAPEDELKEVKVTFAPDGKLKVNAKGKDMEGTYKLDPSKKPRHIDLTVDEGGKELSLKGIYELKKDSLKVCVAEPGGERPTEFATKEGVQTMLIMFKREKK